MELRYNRKLSENCFGSHYICVPRVIVDALKTKEVCLVFDGNHVVIEPVV
jgi:hypothetical protein